MMGAAFLDMIVVLAWPLVLSAAAWAIAVHALAERDEISVVVAALTQPAHSEPVLAHSAHSKPVLAQSVLARPKGVGDNAKAGGVSSRRGNASAAASGERGWFQVQPSLRTALLILLAAELIATAAPPARAERFEFDSRRSEVRFVYMMAYSKQRGRFTKVSGTLDYDAAAPEKTKVSASISAASLTTGEALVDSELKGAAFFNVAAAPTIAFRSLVVKPRSATVADVTGEITVNGITKPVTLNVSLKPHDDPALKHDAGAREFIATTRIQRSAFNMTDYQSMVDDDIEIEIVAIARPR